jgi:hypothetical protein
MVTLAQVKLPGVYFLPPLAQPGLGLPPLDVAGFVGLAERGPLDLPVALEDAEEFRAVFGGDLPLARTPQGAPVFAHLGRAVAAFFANGGRRCYAVRVAGPAAAPTRLRVPGLVALDPDGDAAQAALWTSSAGAWGAALRIAARLSVTPLRAADFSVAAPGQLVWAAPAQGETLQAGDVLRITLDAAPDSRWLVALAAPVQPVPGADAQIDAGRAWEALTRPPASPAPHVARAAHLTPDGESALAADAVLAEGDTGALLLIQGETGLVAGDLVRLDLHGGGAYLVALAEQRPEDLNASPVMPLAEFTAPALLRLPAEPLPAGTPTRVERLRFDLHVLLDDAPPLRLSDLGFNRGQPRFWGETVLLESSPLFSRSRAQPRSERRTSMAPSAQNGRPATAAAQAAAAFRILQTGQRSDDPRRLPLDTVALAGLLAPLGAAETAPTFLPLGMPGLLTAANFTPPRAEDLGSDDLAQMDDERFARLFLDEYLTPQPLSRASGESARTLLAAAFDRYYIQNRRLHGLHSLLFTDEVALISLPDALHRLWQDAPALTLPQLPPLPAPPPEPVCPEPSSFRNCLPDAAGAGSAIAAPLPAPPGAPDPRIAALPLRVDPEDYSLAPLLAVQRGLAHACAARGDVVAILGLPEHFEQAQCVAWLDALRAALNLPAIGQAQGATSEQADLSYLAVYHPWLLEAGEGERAGLSASPPDGAICGMVAARERARQVWIAPANQPLAGVLGLTPALSTADWERLFALGFNLIRQEPRDFRAMSSHTLSDDHTLLQLSVRRLMILLRKVALQRGMDFVFESNHARFREGVRVLLEEMLQFMFERGAFAGATPDQAYRVVTDASVNTRQSIDQGRFIAQIQVAPSQPMEFITVLLTRTGQGQVLAAEV